MSTEKLSYMSKFVQLIGCRMRTHFFSYFWVKRAAHIRSQMIWLAHGPQSLLLANILLGMMSLIQEEVDRHWNLKGWFDIENRIVVAKVERGERGMEWEFGINRCKLLYIEWINKVLLYSTGNYIQYPMIKHNGQEY